MALKYNHKIKTFLAIIQYAGKSKNVLSAIIMLLIFKLLNVCKKFTFKHSHQPGPWSKGVRLGFRI